MNYRMIAMDLDGTLTNSEKKISRETYDRLIEAQEKGMIVVLASGRPEKGMEGVADELKLDKYGGYVLAANGAKIINWKTKETVFENPVPHSSLPDIISICDEYNMPLLTHEYDHLIVQYPDNKYIIAEAAVNKLPIQKIDDFLTYIHFPIYKFIAVGDGDYLAKMEPIVREALAPACDVYRSTPYFMEIVAAGVDKADGVEIIARLNGFGMEDVVACGDGYNDISMIKRAGLGVAMDNSEKGVKPYADYVTLDNDHDGIARLFDELIKLD